MRGRIRPPICSDTGTFASLTSRSAKRKRDARRCSNNKRSFLHEYLHRHRSRHERLKTSARCRRRNHSFRKYADLSRLLSAARLERTEPRELVRCRSPRAQSAARRAGQGGRQGHLLRRTDARARHPRRKGRHHPSRHSLERRPDGRGDQILKRSIREGQTLSVHGQHCFRGLHRAQAALAEKARARELCPHQKDHAAQGLSLLPPFGRVCNGRLGCERHALLRRPASPLEHGYVPRARHHKPPAPQTL